MKLVVATKNKKKLAEIRDILKGIKLDLVSLEAYRKAPEVVENGKTFRDNAIKKARQLARFTGELCLGEDSGLCVNALGGAPGIYSARFAGKEKNDDKNNQKLLKMLHGHPALERKAYYVCAVALADKRGLVGVVEGKCPGLIAFEPAGHTGFGYDPLFYIPKHKKTFAQLGEKIKHTMSHRYHALRQAKPLIQKYIVKHRAS